MMKISAKPINFKFNDYLSNGYEFLKNNFGNLFVAFLLCIVMSIIPFCSFLAIGNFYKYCRNLKAGRQASPGDIFNFDNFMAYFVLQLILIGAVLLLCFPMMIFMPVAAMANGGEPSAGLPIFVVIYMIAMYIVILIVSLKAFYMIGLISLGGVRDIKTAWQMSSTMSKGNLLSIFLFSLVVSILGQLGILACGIGLFLTLPFVHTSHYFAYEDALQQVGNDEIKEIGSKNEF